MNGIQAVEHDGVLVGMRLLALVRERLGMRAVMDAARVQRCVSRLDVVLTEEIAVVIEEELVVVRIAMEEGDAQRVRVLLERPRQEAAHHGALGHERRVRARRQMGAVAHDGPDVAHVDLPGREIALPAHHVDRIERIEDLRDLVLDLDAHFPFAIVVEVRARVPAWRSRRGRRARAGRAGPCPAGRTPPATG